MPYPYGYRKRLALAKSRRLARYGKLSMIRKNPYRKRYTYAKKTGGYSNTPRDVEFKNIDYGENVASDTTGVVRLLNGCSRGDDISDRVGRKIRMKSIQLTLKQLATAGTGIDQEQRILLVYDTQANATALTGAQVLESFDPTAFKKLENRARFRILLDKVIHLNASGEPNSIQMNRYYLNLNLPVVFNNGDNGTIADIVTGSLYLLVVGSVAAGVTAGTCGIHSRIRFTDE